MILFAVCLRHPATCNNFSHTSRLLERTLLSLENQSKKNFRVVVVCGEMPLLTREFSNTLFHVVPFKVPENRHEMLMDKGLKRLVALQSALQDEDITHIAMLDADDLLSQDFVSKTDFLLKRYPNGLCLQRGFLLDYNNRQAQEKFGLNYYCGTSLVLQCESILKALKCERSQFLSLSSQEEFQKHCDEFAIKNLLGNHREPYAYFKRLERPLKNIYIPLVCWVVNNGENLSKTTIGRGSINLSAGFCNKFAIEKSQSSRASMFDRAIERARFVKSLLGHLLRQCKNI